MNRSIWVLGGLLLLSALCGCDEGPPTEFKSEAPRVHRTYHNPSGWVDGWTDETTGCQYLGDSGPYALRYTVDGKPWCGLPSPQQRGRPAGVAQ